MDLAAALRRARTARRQGRVDVTAEAALAATDCDLRLAAYGTLRPGTANAGELVDCPGEWTIGTVTGRRAQRRYPVFTFDPTAPPVAVQVLCSRELPRQWARLDAFEGDGYRRIVVPVLLADGRAVVANLYEAVDPVA